MFKESERLSGTKKSPEGQSRKLSEVLKMDPVEGAHDGKWA